VTLTKRQRLAILDRDDHQSQLLHYSEERGWYKGGYCENGGVGCTHLHVHHVIPAGIGKKLGWDREQRDHPRNVITLYQCEHVGICPSRKMLDLGSGNNKYLPEWVRNDDFEPYVFHPDITYATRNYNGTSLSFDMCFELRKEAMREGRKYWQPEFDLQLLETARERTRLAQSRGWHFLLIGEKRK